MLQAGTAPGQQPQAVQVEDGVGNDACCPALVPAGRHHQHGDPAAPRRPEHQLVPLHDALQGHHTTKSETEMGFQVHGFGVLDAC